MMSDIFDPSSFSFLTILPIDGDHRIAIIASYLHLYSTQQSKTNGYFGERAARARVS
jgi:hypothetical protein